MGSGAQLGVHSAWDESGSSSAGSFELADFVTNLAAAPLDMIYAMTMTPPDQMWILPRDRWSELHITEWTAPLDCSDSAISPVAIRATMMALPITSAGRFSPLGPLGIAAISQH